MQALAKKSNGKFVIIFRGGAIVETETPTLYTDDVTLEAIIHSVILFDKIPEDKIDFSNIELIKVSLQKEQ